MINCPVCSSDKYKSLSVNLHLCKKCSIAFNSEYKPLSYDNDYFLNEYKMQYGKTYLEDFDNIYNSSQKRLKIILRLIDKYTGKKNLTLLDIGSAMGFFLKCAKDSGIAKVTGIEISEYASNFSNNEFGINVIQSSFSNAGITDSYDIITAWFFIEHCEDPVSIINKIYNITKRNGIFALSVPSLFGPLFRQNKAEWIKSHPGDHKVDFTPLSIKKLLKNTGFRKILVKPAGIHPERVCPSNSLLFRPFSYLYNIFSNTTAFSDTIEVYAVK